MNFRPSRGISTNFRNGIMSFTLGSHALRLCFMAETTIFSILSTRSCRRSEKRQSRNDNSSKPISVAFSAIHSMRSMFFVGAMAK